MVRQKNGQAIIESILAIALFMSLAIFVAGEFRSNEVLAGIISGPWRSLDGQIKNGYWIPRDTSDQMHPSHHIRHVSIKGEK